MECIIIMEYTEKDRNQKYGNNIYTTDKKGHDDLF